MYIQVSLFGALLGVLFSPENTIKSPNKQRMQKWKWLGFQLITKRSLSAGVLIGLGAGLSFASSVGRSYGWSDWIRDGCVFGICYGLTAALLSMLVHHEPIEENKGTLQEKISTSFWEDLWLRFISTGYLRQAILIGLTVGGGSVLAYGVTVTLIEGLVPGLLF